MKIRRIRSKHAICALFILVLLAGGCAKRDLGPSIFGPAGPSLVAKSKDFVIVVAGSGDSLRSLARRFLGDKDKFWVIADFNRISRVVPGQEVVIPLKDLNPVGIYSNGYRMVPILCYHRFGNGKAKLNISALTFERQMAYLHDNGYRVVPLSALITFVEGKGALPCRAVIITIDDGYKSVYKVAYPILKKYGFPATLFVYNDFIGARAGLNWSEMKEMVGSGLIDIQAHSKSHSNLTLPKINEDTASYRRRVRQEVLAPIQQIRKHLALPLHSFAYPYGDTNDLVIERLKELGYSLGVTVQRGGNSSFAYPFMLRRTMVLNNCDMKTFKAILKVFEKASLK
jgi:peptidoglycan/xylan/chitin deacetylase (PgdA/CDA1 family)